MVVVMGEARGTPSYVPPTMQSPRYGGCVSSFFNLFDWTSAKRFSSTKRLPASKSEKGSFRRSRSFRTDHGKTRMRYDAQNGVESGHAAMRPPGVVARLMGLDSLPEAPGYNPPPRHRRSQSYSGAQLPNFHPDDISTPVLLQDLLKQDFKPSKTKSLRERLPTIFTKRAHRQYETRFTKSKRGSALTAFRCRSEEWCISPAYIDIPQAQSRFLYTMAQKQGKQQQQQQQQQQHQHQQQLPFLSRLPASSSIHGEQIPELSLRASSMGREILLQGWPLAGQHNVPRDIYHDTPSSSSDLEESVGSKPTDSASSKPLLTNANSKLAQGRRRGSSWNGSEDSGSTIDQAMQGPSQRSRTLKKTPPPNSQHRLQQSLSPAPRHRNSRPNSRSLSNEPQSKVARRGNSSRSPAAAPKAARTSSRDTDRQPLIIQVENSRTSTVSHRSMSTGTSQSSVTTGEQRSVSSKAPTGMAGRGKSSKTGTRAGHPGGAKSASKSSKLDASPSKVVVDDAQRRLGKTVASARSSHYRSPAMAPGKPPPDRAPKARHPKGSSSLDTQSDVSGDGNFHHLPKSSVLTHDKPWNGRKEGDKLHASPKLQRFTEKAAAGGVLSKPKSNTSSLETVQGLGDRLKKGSHTNAEDMASQRLSQSDELAVHSSFKRMKQSHARAGSVDALFPDQLKSLDCESTENLRLHRPVERVLFSLSPDFNTECRNGASSMAGGDQISTSPLIDYDELCYSGEYGKEGEGISSSPLIDCDELRGLGGSMNHNSAENESSISVELYQEKEFLAPDEVRWEDEIVETILSGRCCERSCSGPSISSRSVNFSDDERNGDSWSSCASYNPGDCDSPSDALSDVSPRTNFEVDVDAEVLHQEPKSPPLQFVQKILEESLVDEAAGQPSPVSILQSPFHDETCTTAESSPESLRQFSSKDSVVDEERDDLPPAASNSDKLKQALLDISMFRIHDECTFEHAAPREHPKDEQSFIREVLSAANFLSTPGSSPNWYNKDFAIDPALFDRLESEGVTLTSGGLWRCDRKLLFDCVNEAFGLSSLWHFQVGGEEIWIPELVWRSSRPRGQELVVTVVNKIDEWRKLASYAIDSLIERDMSIHFGSWKYIGPEVAEVGVEIESMVWKGILDEVVIDFVSTTQKNSEQGRDRLCVDNSENTALV